MGLCDLRNFFPPLKHCPRYLSPKPPLSERGLAVDLPVSNIWSFAVAKVKFINYALLGTKIIMKIPLCNFHNEFCIIFKNQQDRQKKEIMGITYIRTGSNAGRVS